MDDMNASEIIEKLAAENQTRKILEIIKGSKDLKEAEEKVKALLSK